ncbi:MAG: alpha/beta hydrolase, partial [Methanosarcina sp.]
MNNKTLIYAVLLIMTVACPGCISQQDRSQTDTVHGQNIENIEDIKGLWIGNLDVPGGVELRILFNISTRPDGSVNATMDSLDQGARGIPVEKITYKDSNLSLEVKSVRGVFEGTLNESGKT